MSNPGKVVRVSPAPTEGLFSGFASNLVNQYDILVDLNNDGRDDLITVTAAMVTKPFLGWGTARPESTKYGTSKSGTYTEIVSTFKSNDGKVKYQSGDRVLNKCSDVFRKIPIRDFWISVVSGTKPNFNKVWDKRVEATVEGLKFYLLLTPMVTFEDGTRAELSCLKK